MARSRRSWPEFCRFGSTSRLQKLAGTAWLGCPTNVLAPMPADTSDDQSPAEAPHYHGHRERLRERFHGAGPDALSDYELLEMVLFTAHPGRDIKPLAKSLLKKFGSFAEVIHAPEPRLREVKGIGDASINQLKLIAAAASRIAKGPLQGRPLLSSWNAVIDYCRTTMAFADKEQFSILFPGQAQSTDRRRSTADRHRRPYPGLSVRSDQARAGIIRHGCAAGAQPSLRRSDAVKCGHPYDQGDHG